MNDLIIKGEKKTYFTPDVNFSAKTGVCEIAGESYQEETFSFFNELIAWLEEYTLKVRKAIIFNVKLTYFNTSSARALLEMLLVLKKYKAQGAEVEINWYVQQEDEGMSEEAEDLQIQSGLNFNIKLL
ncbi:MAG: DUF1987 domain-containing protein [Thermonemataceae bacterium]|nr:DUF1987 domain-containing protein [Thermonemataceae bacterium]